MCLTLFRIVLGHKCAIFLWFYGTAESVIWNTINPLKCCYLNNARALYATINFYVFFMFTISHVAQINAVMCMCRYDQPCKLPWLLSNVNFRNSAVKNVLKYYHIFVNNTKTMSFNQWYHDTKVKISTMMIINYQT